MKNSKKIIVSLIIIFLIVLLNPVCFADDDDSGDFFDEWQSGISEWESKGREKVDEMGVTTEEMASPFVPILQIVTFAGAGLVLVAIIVIAFRIGKNAQSRAEALTKGLVVVIVGAALVFGSVKIGGLILEAMDSVFSDDGSGETAVIRMIENS